MKSPKEKRQFKRQMRRNPTVAELVFKNRLDDLKVTYKHQMVLGWYIPDFVLPQHMIIFELDGDSHKGKEWYDSKRDEFIEKCGFKVIRLKNKEASSFNLEFLAEVWSHPESVFRSALGKANSMMGHTKLKKITNPL